MAARGTVKRFSEEHEEFVARHYGGTRSPSSGGAISDAGDVRLPDHLIECKLTGEPGGDDKRPGFLKHLEKVATEAYAEGRDPVLCLRYWCPTSPLAGRDGWLDLTVRLTAEDAEIVRELDDATDRYDWLLGQCGGTAPT